MQTSGGVCAANAVVEQSGTGKSGDLANTRDLQSKQHERMHECTDTALTEVSVPGRDASMRKSLKRMKSRVEKRLLKRDFGFTI